MSEKQRLDYIRTLVKQWFDTPSEESLLSDAESAYVVLGEIKRILGISGDSKKEKGDKNYGTVPGPCIRLKCHIDACYGWDYCKSARDEASEIEWKTMCDGVFGVCIER